MSAEVLLIMAATLSAIGLICIAALFRINTVTQVRIAYIYASGYEKILRALPSHNEMVNDFRYWNLWKKSDWDKWLAADRKEAA